MNTIYNLIYAKEKNSTYLKKKEN